MLGLLQVRLMEFSPNEKYAVSYSAEEPRGPREKASLTLNIFDTFSGACLCRISICPPMQLHVSPASAI